MWGTTQRDVGARMVELGIHHMGLLSMPPKVEETRACTSAFSSFSWWLFEFSSRR